MNIESRNKFYYYQLLVIETLIFDLTNVLVQNQNPRKCNFSAATFT